MAQSIVDAIPDSVPQEARVRFDFLNLGQESPRPNGRRIGKCPHCQRPGEVSPGVVMASGFHNPMVIHAGYFNRGGIADPHAGFTITDACMLAPEEALAITYE